MRLDWADVTALSAVRHNHGVSVDQVSIFWCEKEEERRKTKSLTFFFSPLSFAESFGETHSHEDRTYWINCRMDNGTTLVIDDPNALGVPAQEFPSTVDVEYNSNGITTVLPASLPGGGVAVDVLDHDTPGGNVGGSETASPTSGGESNLVGGAGGVQSTDAGGGGDRKSRALQKLNRGLLGRRRRGTDDYKTPRGIYKVLLVE